MIQDYQQAEKFLADRTAKLGMDFGLERMERVLRKLGNPERSIPCIHIAGSNGKGSTLTFLKHILVAEGYRVGTFTSPYLEKLNEQIMIDEEMISDNKLVELLNYLLPVINESEQKGDYLTAFEVTTILAFLHFKNEQPDILIIETGLGGRLDSTNVIEPLLEIITSISLEHTNILGNSLGEIATEKAGIIKNGTSVVTGVKDEEALEPLTKQAEKMNAALYTLGKEFKILNRSHPKNQEVFTVKWREYLLENLHISMLGSHQVENAALAVISSILLSETYRFSIREESIRKGLASARWKGRFEIVSNQPLIILDGAHNVSGINSLLSTIDDRYPNCDIHILFAALKDKDYTKMIQMIEQKAASITFTEIPLERMNEAEELFKHSRHPHKDVKKDWVEGINEILAKMKDRDMLLVTGSLYFLASIRPYIVNEINRKS
ncbi:folylpolyglutamate synthase/dihydrofolate synthase family protein [Bacillus sp. D386]|uniref:bifunctional folylpolyglutamate synthase/dihydrofolate synthase n=1 Tax=Bacillus sp. D386 TaxID=2587155 RepID=UPI001120F58C|nr:folylpolyglutamate synthase/dihydrofolate synthase family protein [Bacillus sp. D386]